MGLEKRKKKGKSIWSLQLSFPIICEGEGEEERKRASEVRLEERMRERRSLVYIWPILFVLLASNWSII